MIEWKENHGNPQTLPYKHYLVTNGNWVVSAVPAILPFAESDWLGEGGYVQEVTHYAEINLP
jgi:hypothetical protein